MEVSLRFAFCVILILKLVVNGIRAQSFPDFKNCLLGKGIDQNDIVPRSNSNEYKRLNFQRQLRGPTIYPLAFILVRTEEDVASTVICAQKHKIRIVAICGGHSYEKYSFGDKDSVVVDLQLMKSVTLNSFGTTATVGAGALIGPVAMTLWNSGRVMIPVGTCPTVGISGLATGGGYSYLSRAYGLTTDYIKGMRIVTADGRILTANRHMNSDLFWALRGGGAASFGIVTSFVFKVVPPPLTIYVENLSFTLTSFVSVFKAWQHFTIYASRTLSGRMLIFNETIIVTLLDVTGTDLRLAAFKKLLPPPQLQTRNWYSYPDFLVFATQGVVNLPVGYGPQDLLTLTRMSSIQLFEDSKSFFFQKVATDAEISELNSLLQKVPPKIVLFVAPYGGAINDVKVHATSYVHRKGRYAIAEIINLPTPRNASEIANKVWVERIFDLGKTIFNQRESYQNYQDAELSDYLVRYYGGNLKRLVQVKRIYDPKNFFHNPQSIPTNYTVKN